jgi:hypothetical protein
MRTQAALLAGCGLFLFACASGTDRNTPPVPASSGGSGGSTSTDTGGTVGTPPSSGNTSGGSGGTSASGGTTGSGGITASGGSGGTSETPDAAPVATTDGASAPASDGGSVGATFPGTFPNCPNCKAIYDGKSTAGWTSWGKSGAGIGMLDGNWDILDGALHSTGKMRNVLATNGDYNDFRLIFQIRHLKPTGNAHQPCIVIWGRRPAPNDAMGGIQIQAPHTSMWDYRPGQNKNIGGMKVGTANINDANWSQCEVLAHGSKGDFRMACCQLAGNGETPCKGTELLHFTVAGSGNNGPISLQAHNAGLLDEYKGIFVEENPTVDDLITTK